MSDPRSWGENNAAIEAAKREILAAMQNDTAGETAQTKVFTEFVTGIVPYDSTVDVTGKGRCWLSFSNNRSLYSVVVDGKQFSISYSPEWIEIFFEKSLSITTPKDYVAWYVIYT